MTKESNPANIESKTAAERKRIPMNIPVQKLQVDEIPGYVLYWFRNDPGRVQRALRAGYEFVEENEIQVNYTGLGSDSASSGNTDMGSRVSVVSGDDISSDGQPARLVLMKIKKELHEEDLAAQARINDRVAASLRGDFETGKIGAENDPEPGLRYVDKTRSKTNLFTPKN